MTPLLFMGQEWAASTPFLYFTDHDPELGALVTAGRRREFAAFAAFSDPARRETIPDPQAPQTFERSKLHWDERQVEPHARVLTLYRELLALRRSDPVLGLACSRAELSPTTWGQLLLVRRRGRDGSGDRVLLANFGKESVSLGTVPGVGAGARVLFGSQASAAQGDIPPLGAVVVEPAEHLRVR
jgi:maltooligosyltrehalose trehalohydrolase